MTSSSLNICYVFPHQTLFVWYIWQCTCIVEHMTFEDFGNVGILLTYNRVVPIDSNLTRSTIIFKKKTTTKPLLWWFQLHLRSILVRTILCPIHPATCTRPWRASSKIAWVLYQLGTPLNARKSTSAMSEQIILLNKPEKAITTTTTQIYSPCANWSIKIVTAPLLCVLGIISNHEPIYWLGSLALVKLCHPMLTVIIELIIT